MSTSINPSPLSERERLVMRLRDEERLTFRAISEQIGVNHQRARAIYVQAKSRLRRFGRYPMDGLAMLHWTLRHPLFVLGFRTMDEVHASMVLGHLAWSEAQRWVCWKGKPVGQRGWWTWDMLHQRLGLPRPVAPAAAAVKSCEDGGLSTAPPQ